MRTVLSWFKQLVLARGELRRPVPATAHPSTAALCEKEGGCCFPEGCAKLRALRCPQESHAWEASSWHVPLVTALLERRVL